STADGQRGTPRRPSADGVTRLPSPLPYVFHLQGIAPKLLTHRRPPRRAPEETASGSCRPDVVLFTQRGLNPVEVIKISPRGYCYGVVDAINLAKKAAKDPHVPKPVHILGAIVHN